MFYEAMLCFEVIDYAGTINEKAQIYESLAMKLNSLLLRQTLIAPFFSFKGYRVRINLFCTPNRLTQFFFTNDSVKHWREILIITMVIVYSTGFNGIL